MAEYQSKRVWITQIDDSGKRYQVRTSQGLTFKQVAELKRASDQHVKRLQAALSHGKRLKPMQVVKGVNGKYVIVDGWHRYQAYRKRGIKQITVHVFDEVGSDHYLNLNTQHQGLMLISNQLTEMQWQKYLTLEMVPSMEATPTNAELVAELGVNRRTVREWRKLRREAASAGVWETADTNTVTQRPIKASVSLELKKLDSDWDGDRVDRIKDAVDVIANELRQWDVPDKQQILQSVAVVLDWDFELGEWCTELEEIEDF